MWDPFRSEVPFPSSEPLNRLLCVRIPPFFTAHNPLHVSCYRPNDSPVPGFTEGYDPSASNVTTGVCPLAHPEYPAPFLPCLHYLMHLTRCTVSPPQSIPVPCVMHDVFVAASNSLTSYLRSKVLLKLLRTSRPLVEVHEGGHRLFLCVPRLAASPLVAACSSQGPVHSPHLVTLGSAGRLSHPREVVSLSRAPSDAARTIPGLGIRALSDTGCTIPGLGIRVLSDTACTIPGLGIRALPNTGCTIPGLGIRALSDTACTIPGLGIRALSDTACTIPGCLLSQSQTASEVIPGGRLDYKQANCSQICNTPLPFTEIERMSVSGYLTTQWMGKSCQDGGNLLALSLCCFAHFLPSTSLPFPPLMVDLSLSSLPPQCPQPPHHQGGDRGDSSREGDGSGGSCRGRHRTRRKDEDQIQIPAGSKNVGRRNEPPSLRQSECRWSA
ncbi:uncharacterized protein [Narcine bancroftii]|uniref:uncharacterized protein isoform X2 n=1 Tax=Narcine bancroftii TaxID=1343680 RepID=UPI003831E3BD